MCISDLKSLATKVFRNIYSVATILTTFRREVVGKGLVECDAYDVIFLFERFGTDS